MSQKKELMRVLIVDTVAGLIHAAMDNGLTINEAEDFVEGAFTHVRTERNLTREGYCSMCERKFSTPKRGASV